MGPEATVDFMSKVIAMTPVRNAQDYIHLIIDHNRKVPNRQAAILNLHPQVTSASGSHGVHRERGYRRDAGGSDERCG
jgi:aspartate racemase